MRTTFTLNRAITPKPCTTKRWQLNGKDTTKQAIIKLCQSKGIDISEREFASTAPATEYKGIGIGNMLWGWVIWARKEEDTEKLMSLLIEDGYFDHKCSMPVERKNDK